MRLLWNGNILGKSVRPTTSAASGIWDLDANLINSSLTSWPGVGFTVVQTFTATSTWTCPAGVTEVEYLVVAGGGGTGSTGTGAGTSGTTNTGGGGGAGRTGNGGSGGSGIVIIKINQ